MQWPTLLQLGQTWIPARKKTFHCIAYLYSRNTNVLCSANDRGGTSWHMRLCHHLLKTPKHTPPNLQSQHMVLSEPQADRSKVKTDRRILPLSLRPQHTRPCCLVTLPRPATTTGREIQTENPAADHAAALQATNRKWSAVTCPNPEVTCQHEILRP